MFSLQAVLLIPVILIFFGLLGYLVKSRILKKIKLNSYIIGITTYVTIFEIISIPLILYKTSFSKFYYIMLFVTFVLFLISLRQYINDYRFKNINHKYRFLVRYWENRYIYNFIAIIIIVFTTLMLFFPITRLRDDDVHWLINIKDNIKLNTIMTTYTENGTYIKLLEMYAFNAYTLMLSFFTSLFSIEIMAFVLVTFRVVLIFIVLFSFKDLFYYFDHERTVRNWGFTFCITFVVLWTNIWNFYELPFFIVFPTVGQRLLIILIIPMLQILIKGILEKFTREDLILFILFAINLIFYATTLTLVILILILYFGIIYIVQRKWFNILTITIFSIISIVATIFTMYLYSKNGHGITIMSEYLYNKYHFDDNNIKVPSVSQWTSWYLWIINMNSLKFIIPIVLILYDKQINKIYKYIAGFIVFIDVVFNPFINTSVIKIIPTIIIERTHFYYSFLGYLLVYPALKIIFEKVNSKSDSIKLGQTIMMIYLVFSCTDVTHFFDRNFNMINVRHDTLWAVQDWDRDDYYPIDKYQLEVYNEIKDYYPKRHYVVSTSEQATNYRLRFFDNNAYMITPRNRVHQSINFKDDINKCLNESYFLSDKTLNVCKDMVSHYTNTAIIVSNRHKNQFYNYLSKEFSQLVQNKRYTVYVKENNGK